MTAQGHVFKRGDTVLLACEARDAAGTLVDLAGTSIRAQVRMPDGQMLADMVVTRLPSLGSFELSLSTATTQWPVGAYECDIEYTSPDGFVVSTQTFGLTLVKDVTR